MEVFEDGLSVGPRAAKWGGIEEAGLHKDETLIGFVERWPGDDGWRCIGDGRRRASFDTSSRWWLSVGGENSVLTCSGR